jgi:hypothetical protein
VATSCRRTIAWPQNTTRVNVDDPGELQFWCWRFRVGAECLKRAVGIVGYNFKDVVTYLQNQQ